MASSGTQSSLAVFIQARVSRRRASVAGGDPTTSLRSLVAANVHRSTEPGFFTPHTTPNDETTSKLCVR